MREYVYEVEVEYGTFGGWFSQKRREEIVRCRDCKFSINDGMQCKRHKDSGWNGNAYCEEYACVNPDGYCAWGESKEVTEL